MMPPVVGPATALIPEPENLSAIARQNSMASPGCWRILNFSK